MARFIQMFVGVSVVGMLACAAAPVVKDPETLRARPVSGSVGEAKVSPPRSSAEEVRTFASATAAGEGLWSSPGLRVQHERVGRVEHRSGRR
jgi:hypothetical protein